MAHILIIDDDPDIRDLLSIYLEGEGHVLSHAVNGQDGIDQATQTPPDLIILDINMPVMDGTRVVKNLRGAAVTSKIPVIALSAVGGAQMRDDMHRLGCDAYVTKPIDFTVLIGKIDALLAA